MKNNDIFKKQKAIINSMTPKERNYPDLVKASRKIRIFDISHGSTYKKPSGTKIFYI